MKKIKVLHIIKTFNLGGAETNLLNMLRYSDSGQVEPHIAYSFGGPFESEFRKLGLPLFKYAEKEFKVQSPSSFLIVMKLALYILKNKIDVVHTHTYNAHVWGAVAAKMSGAKIVEHVHDFRYEESDYLRSNGIARPEQFKQAGAFARLSDKIVVLTKNNRNFLLRNRYATEKKVCIVPNAIPLNDFVIESRQDLWMKAGVPLNKKIIFWAVRLSSEKNPAFVLDMARALKGRTDVVFVVAGDGPLRSEMNEAVKNRQLENVVKFIGFWPEPLKLLSVCDIAIQPTFLELHSIMMMEAMSVKKPVLVSRDVGCNNDFITHGINGYLLDPRNASEWVAVIEDLLEHPQKAVQVGLAGRRLLEENYNMTRLNADFNSIYRELCDE